LLESSMASDDQTIKLSFEGDDLIVSALSIAGGVDQLGVGLDAYDDSKDIMANGQYLNKEIFTKVLGILDTPKVKISILESLNNSPCVEHEVAGNPSYSVVVPLPNKTF